MNASRKGTNLHNNSYATLGSKISSSWIENELRAFNWILIALSALTKTPIADFVRPALLRAKHSGICC